MTQSPQEQHKVENIKDITREEVRQTFMKISRKKVVGPGNIPIDAVVCEIRGFIN